MLSQMTVVGMPSAISSQAVRRAPCRKGRVSSAKTWMLLALLDGGADDAEGGAVAAGGQGAGVAVGEDAALVGQQRGAECAHGFAGGDVFVVHGVGFGEDSFLDLGEGCAGCQQIGEEALHAVDGPEEIDGGGAGSGEAGADAVELGREFARWCRPWC